jgi:carbon monoxide dehydrogenase subunit G
MRLEHRFRVPAAPDETWTLLLDARLVESLLPGLTLDEVVADEVTGSVRVDIGPGCRTYRGEAAFTELHPAVYRLVVEAAGRETGGSGTASATLAVALEPDGDATTVLLRTELDLAGGPQPDRAAVAAGLQRVVDQLAVGVAARLRERVPSGAGGAEHAWLDDPVHPVEARHRHPEPGPEPADDPAAPAGRSEPRPPTASGSPTPGSARSDQLVARPRATPARTVRAHPAPAGRSLVVRPRRALAPRSASALDLPWVREGSVAVGLVTFVVVLLWLLRRLRR